MKTRFFLPICLVAAMSIPAWGATLLYEGFNGMEKGKLPKGWESSKAIDYYTNTTYSPVPPSVKFDKEFSISSRPFSPGATNVSFLAYTANDSGHCNHFKISGWLDGEWTEIALVTNMDVKQFQTISVPVSNPDITRVQIDFVNKSYNAAVDDIKVEGPFSLLCDHEDEFTLPQGTGDAIKVWADYDFATSDTEFEYVWSGALEETGDVLEIPDNLEPGTYELTCTCTAMVDGEEEASTSGSISFRVLKYHDITVEASEHGTVTPGVDSAVEGTTVLLEATPESAEYVLSWIAVNGEKLPPETLEFQMPDSNVVVTAFFKLDEEGDLIVTFDDNSTKNPAYASESFFARCIAGGVVVSNQFNALNCYGGDKRGTSGTDLAMRVKHEGETKGFFATADELEHPIARISFDYKAYSKTHTNRLWALETSTDGAHWTNMATVKTTSADWGETCEVKEGIPANSFWFRIISSNTVKSSVMANFDNINIWWGEESYRVKLLGVKPDEKRVCDSDDPLVLTAEGRAGVEDYEYAWTWKTEDGRSGTAEGETCAFTDTGVYDVEVTCTDAEGKTASASVRFMLDTQYKVTWPAPVDGCYIVVNTNKAFAGDPITVQDKPKYGYTLDGPLTATWSGGTEEIIDGVFTMPAGDVEISGTFRKVKDVATLPFEYHGPWQSTTNFNVDGMLTAKLSSDVKDANYDDQGNGAAKFGDQSSVIHISFDSAPDTLSYMIRGESLSECTCTVFIVQESEDGDDWTTAVKYESTEQVPPNTNTLAETFALKPATRYVKFGYKDMSKGTGAIGVDAIIITKGEGGDPVETKIMGSSLSFEDGNAMWNVTLDPAVSLAGSDIWATTNLLTGEWQPAEGAAVEESDGNYLITVPEAPGTLFISVGKPDILSE